MATSIVVRAPHADDTADIMRIVREHHLPKEWRWPMGKHGLVADHGGRVVAFCILNETIYGLVIEELWEEETRKGFHGLTLLGRAIETIAQDLSNEKGEPLACGGVIRLEKSRHIAALRKRDYEDVAVVMQKRFLPETANLGIEETA